MKLVKGNVCVVHHIYDDLVLGLLLNCRLFWARNTIQQNPIMLATRTRNYIICKGVEG